MVCILITYEVKLISIIVDGVRKHVQVAYICEIKENPFGLCWIERGTKIFGTFQTSEALTQDVPCKNHFLDQRYYIQGTIFIYISLHG